METELAASAAKLAVFQASDAVGSRAPSDGMNTYLRRIQHQQPVNVLDPTAKEFNPGFQKPIQHINMTNGFLPPPLPTIRGYEKKGNYVMVYGYCKTVL